MLHQIGVGSLGPVYRAYQPELDRLVAVKMFRLDVTDQRALQFATELEKLIAADLTHPGIAAPVGTGMAGPSPYLAQDFVAADSLDLAFGLTVRLRWPMRSASPRSSPAHSTSRLEWDFSTARSTPATCSSRPTMRG